RRFILLATVNLILLVVGYALFANILAPFVTTHAHVGPAAIGIMFVVNTFFVAVAQVPIARLFEPFRRAWTFAAASGLFAVALLGFLLVGDRIPDKPLAGTRSALERGDGLGPAGDGRLDVLLAAPHPHPGVPRLRRDRGPRRHGRLQLARLTILVAIRKFQRRRLV